MTCIFVY